MHFGSDPPQTTSDELEQFALQDRPSGSRSHPSAQAHFPAVPFLDNRHSWEQPAASHGFLAGFWEYTTVLESGWSQVLESGKKSYWSQAREVIFKQFLEPHWDF